MAYSRAVFRSVFGRVMTVVMAVLMAAAVGAIVATNDLWGIVCLVWTPILAAVLTWAIMWRPHVVVDHGGVDVVNLVSTWHVPWGAIQRIDTKWALELTTEQGRITAFAAPAPSRYGVAKVTRDDIRLARESSLVGESIRPGDSVESISGAAAHVTRTHWEELRDAGELAEGERATRTWHPRIIAALAGLGVLALVGQLVH